MIRARTSAAMASQTRGANSTKVGRNLAEVVHHRVGLLDEVDLHPAEQGFAQGIDLLHDPGQRQHRDVLVVRPLGIDRRDRRRNGAAGAPAAASRAWAAPWCRRSCTGWRHPRPGWHRPIDRRAPARAPRGARPSAASVAGLDQARVGILAHAARIAIDDVRAGRARARPGRAACRPAPRPRRIRASPRRSPADRRLPPSSASR